jgi:hypothetical protein
MTAVRRTYSLGVELGIIALTLLAWQTVRLPFEGSQRESLAHAGDWLAAERELRLDIEAALIRFVHEHAQLHELADVAYLNLHLPVVVGLLGAARLRAPDRYPKLRTAFVLTHIPALAVIAVYPLAPPSWLTSLPYAAGPPAELADLHNKTAAAASLHFGYAVLVAAVSLWLWPRAPLAWSALLYPPLVFALILGTGNHYVLDTLLGAGCVLAGATAAWLIHRPSANQPPTAPARTADDRRRDDAPEALVARRPRHAVPSR